MILLRRHGFGGIHLKGPVLSLGMALFIFMAAVVRADDRSAPATDAYHKAARLYEKGRWGQAKELFHQYLAEYSDSALYVTSLYYLGYCYQQLGNTREAISIYHKVMDEARGEDAFWGEMAETRTKELEE